ncbi:MAG: hypothetical protein E7596_03575 [Ruminococcaceae bacterium]|nr:hypothetical protein [Oscillospiraceae bacterium]
MKTKVLGMIAVLVIVMLSLLIVSCGDIENTKIETQGLLFENGVYKATVPNSTTSYDILTKITINDDADYEIARDEDFSNKIDSGTINLNPGDNFIYIKVTDGDYESLYSFNVYRKKMVTVTYNANGGTMASNSTTVEEGSIISAPAANKTGYSLSWDYDFTKPVTADVTINAVWTVNNCAISTNVDGVITRFELAYGSIPSGITAPTKFGYDFAGWKYGDVDFDITVPYNYSDTEIEIVAVFKPIEFKIQYILDEGLETNNAGNVTTFTIVTENGEELSIALLAPTHKSANYSFIGWCTDIERNNVIEKIDISTVNGLGDDHKLDLYPKWEIKSNVTYDANGGSCDKATDVFTFGASYELPVPTKDNYNFVGWYAGDNKVANSGVWSLKADADLVAKWSPRQNEIDYVLGYDGATNNPGNPSSFDIEDDEIELLAPTYNENYIFDGWYTNPNFTEESKITHITSSLAGTNITLYAKWITIFEIKLDAANGTCDVSSLKITHGTEYTLPIPTRNKYVFAGWYNGDDYVDLTGVWSIDSAVTLVAKWTPTVYKISYELNGGTNVETNPKEYTVESSDSELALSNPTKEFCKFLGWYLDAELKIPISKIDPTMYEGITLYAKWEAVKVTINYNADGGNVSKNNDVLNLGDNYTLPTPEKTGCIFDGWYLGETRFDDKGRLTDESLTTINLVAKWKFIEYNITYDLDGATENGLNLVKKYTIATEDFALPTPTKNGYIFVGWSYNGGQPSATVVITKGGTGDLAYKAIWVQQKDANGLLYSMVDGKLVVTGIDRVINDSIVAGVKIPATINGVDVVAIESNAFTEFGKKFTKTAYANMSNSYVTFYVPTTVKKIGANAFAECNGIKVSLYDASSSSADWKAWDKTVTWESGNASARDCIWGFRPAIGWTRYSMVEIPDDYE